MSQWGARGLAQHGRSYRQILAHYYPGTRLGRGAPRQVRVLLAAGRKRFVVTSRTPFRIGRRTGRRVVLRPGYVARRGPLRIVPGASPLALDGVPYRGSLVVRSRAGVMAAVNHVSLERYLRGVVPDEMPPDWPREALRAQAVVARSYALATLKPGKHFDLRADTRSQVYNGVRAEEATANRAIGATARRVLVWHGRVATTFYHSTSGGRTAAAWEVWPRAQRVPYLRGVRDPFDGASPHHRWGPLRLDVRALGIPRAQDVGVARGASGRATALVVRGPRGNRRLDPNDVRLRLGLPSTWFRVGVLDLGPPVVRDGKIVLRGVARGLPRPVIQLLEGRGWRQVARVRTRRDGSFTVAVRPLSGAVYRVAAARIAGPRVRIAPSVARQAAASTR
jgi:stage II sporulation protein D